MEIKLSRNQTTIVDDIDGDLSELKWYANLNTSTKTYYVLNGGTLLHRLIMERMMGRKLERNEHVDHRNLNSLDNRRENLRLATQSQNQANRHKLGHSNQPYKGVRKHNQKWNARIYKNGKEHNLGYFDTAEEAHKAYCEKAVELYGDFAKFQ